MQQFLELANMSAAEARFLLPLQIVTSPQRWFSPEFGLPFLFMASCRKPGCQAAHVARGAASDPLGQLLWQPVSRREVPFSSNILVWIKYS